MRSISSYRRRGRLCCCAPGMGTNEYTCESGCGFCSGQRGGATGAPPTGTQGGGGMGTDLTSAGPSRGGRSRRGHGGPRGTVGPVGQAMGVSGVLLRPMRIARGRMALILRHVVVLRGIRRIGRVGRTRGGYRRIYGYFRVRLDVRCVVMVILMPILQGHGRTCCLCHTSCVGVRGLRCVLLTREVFRGQVGRTRRGRIHPKLGRRRRSGRKVGRSHFLRWRILRSRHRICGRFLRIETRRLTLNVDECANLTAGTGRVHLCP